MVCEPVVDLLKLEFDVGLEVEIVNEKHEVRCG